MLKAMTMKIELIWNQPDGSKTSLGGFAVDPNDPHKDDEELQVAKAKVAAQARAHQEFGSAPPINEISVVVLKD